MALRAPTPSRSSPAPTAVRPAASAYAASLEAAAKQQSHVDELIVKNRTLEHTVEKLKLTLTAEDTRSKDTIQKIQQKWEAERAEWREGCDALQTAHRVAHLSTSVELDKERIEASKEKERLRQETVKRLQRDFKLAMFQMQESKQERRLRELEDELELARLNHNKELRTMKLKSKGSTSELQERNAELEAQVAEKEAELVDLHHAELKTKYDELLKSSSDSTRQLEKWRTLESRDITELETLRQQKIKLEITVKDLQNQLDDAKKNGAEKAKAKVVKWKESLEEHQRALVEANEMATRLEADAEQSRIDLEDAAQKLQSLEAQLQAETSKRKALEKRSSTVKSQHTALSPIAGSDPEVEEILSPRQSKPPPKAKPVSRRAQSKQRVAEPAEDSPDIEVVESPVAPKPKSKRRGGNDSDIVENDPLPVKKPRSKKQATPVEVETEAGPSKPKAKRGRPKKSPEAPSDVEVVDVAPSLHKKGKAKAPEVAIEDEDEDVQELPKKKGKGKAPEIVIQDEDEDVQELPTKRKRTKPDDEDDIGRKGVGPSAPAKRGRPPKEKPPSRQPSVARNTIRVDESDDEANATSQPKKKRKINIFASAQPHTFEWGTFGQGGGGGGLDIPTDLSPVKDNDAIPPRSTSRLGSVFGSFSQPGRR
ncbi:hypothetical protein EUX98_g957 [Antrodiella citrinella]|uniref:Uncharacterized protein n=1 Tax=Antrodiella citrinella TaxID=2447956 RepID=A0A4S4N2N3_9APHY|nr:hypothetical protein EUX98_g957 [Antrodiella citrinella]